MHSLLLLACHWEMGGAPLKWGAHHEGRCESSRKQGAYHACQKGELGMRALCSMGLQCAQIRGYSIDVDFQTQKLMVIR